MLGLFAIRRDGTSALASMTRPGRCQHIPSPISRLTSGHPSAEGLLRTEDVLRGLYDLLVTSSLRERLAQPPADLVAGLTAPDAVESRLPRVTPNASR
ncbi:MAG: hypothetical protein KGJ62_01470 [Armatimonadetes bacterium]|nr:hypothetical protein [Armatimonadota bacterium]MDE2205826.1 hypothetical protein [Armatimonadota bacterium]